MSAEGLGRPAYPPVACAIAVRRLVEFWCGQRVADAGWSILMQGDYLWSVPPNPAAAPLFVSRPDGRLVPTEAWWSR